MKKVISINLGGFAFKMDEDAYTMLEQYISSIRSKFKDEKEQQEIIGDIEFRISEIFTAALKKNFREVVEIGDVQEVIKKLGKAETIAGEEEGAGQSSGQSQQQGNFNSEPGEKRLFRNPDDKVIGGVCSGLSAYLGINDPVWMRVIFALFLFFTGGTIALIYIIGMIIIPEAKTTSQKLQMHGKPVTLQNIENNFSSVKDTINNSNLSNGLSNFLYLLLKVIRYAVAGLLIVIGFALLTAFSIALFTGNLNLNHVGDGMFSYLNYLVDDTSLITLFFTALYILVAIPCLSLIMLGIRVLINRSFITIPIRILSISVWILSIILLMYTSRQGYKMFASKASIEETIPVNINNKTLVLKSSGKSDFQIDEDNVTINGHTLKDGKLILPSTKVEIVKSPTAEIFMERVVKSNGKNKEEAETFAKQVVSKMEIKDSVLFIDNIIEINHDKPKYRNQRVKYYLNLPVGAKIFLDATSESLLYDVKNVHDMLDSKMMGHLWIMTEKGLECVDCTEEEKTKYSIHYDEEEDWGDEQAEKKIMKKIMRGNLHIKDGEDEVIIKDGKVIVREGKEEKVIELKETK